VPTLLAAGRHDLADCEWSVLEPLLPRGKRAGRPPKWARRQLINGIRWRARTGSPWRDVPPQYGPWQSVYGLFRRWQRDGTWKRLLTALQALADAAGHVTWDVSVDSGTARARQHAAGARKDGAAQKEPPGRFGDGAPEPAGHAPGRSRGGLTSKFHLACEQGQKPPAVIVRRAPP
jgi:transposase